MEKKSSYEKPEVKVVKFVITDSIAISGNSAIHDEWLWKE